MNYSTTFPATENPISEGGNWINGLATGLLWSNCRVDAGVVRGTQSGTNQTDDSVAIVAGVWGPNQTVTAVANVTGAPLGSNSKEIGLRLNSTLSANLCTGYEFLINMYGGFQLVRWEVTPMTFTVLGSAGPTAPVTGDVYVASRAGNDLTLTKNGVLVFTITETAFMGGGPGVNFFIRSPEITTDYGWSSFSATDGLSSAVGVGMSGDVMRRKFGRNI